MWHASLCNVAGACDSYNDSRRISRARSPAWRARAHAHLDDRRTSRRCHFVAAKRPARSLSASWATRLNSHCNRTTPSGTAMDTPSLLRMAAAVCASAHPRRVKHETADESHSVVSWSPRPAARSRRTSARVLRMVIQLPPPFPDPDGCADAECAPEPPRKDPQDMLPRNGGRGTEYVHA